MIVFWKRITLIAQIIWKLLSPKNEVTWMAESSYFRRPFGSQHVKCSETLLKSEQRQFYANSPLISRKLSCLSCLLVVAEVWGALSNMVRTNDKYSCHNWEKFLQKVQPQLSSKPKIFFASFITFLKFTENFEGFFKKDHVHSSIIFEVIESEKCGYLNARKVLFQNTLLKSTC